MTTQYDLVDDLRLHGEAMRVINRHRTFTERLSALAPIVADLPTHEAKRLVMELLVRP